MSTIIYGRVSTAIQELSTQEQRCKDYVAFKFPGESVVELYDDDTSGSIDIWKRDHGRELRKKIEAGLDRERYVESPVIKHLVVAKLDRLGRNARNLLDAFHWLQDHGVTLHIVDMGGDSMSTQGPAGRLMFAVLAAMAEFERDLIRDRIQQKLDQRRDLGYVTGTVPYGFDAEETDEVSPKGTHLRRLVDNAAEQRWLLHMVQRRELGWSYHKIAQELNTLGVKTKQGAKKKELAALNHPPSTTPGKWQCGNVAKVINSKTTRDWLAERKEQAA